jgi:hypothetical protein
MERESEAEALSKGRTLLAAARLGTQPGVLNLE